MREELWHRFSGTPVARSRLPEIGGRVVVSSSAEHAIEWRPAPGHVPAEELARRHGVRPIVSIDELARPDLFELDEEFDEFLVDLYASRRVGLA